MIISYNFDNNNPDSLNKIFFSDNNASKGNVNFTKRANTNIIDKMSNPSMHAGIGDMFWLPTNTDDLPDNFNIKFRSFNNLELPGSMSFPLLECDSTSYKIDFDKYIENHRVKSGITITQEMLDKYNKVNNVTQES